MEYVGLSEKRVGQGEMRIEVQVRFSYVGLELMEMMSWRKFLLDWGLDSIFGFRSFVGCEFFPNLGKIKR